MNAAALEWLEQYRGWGDEFILIPDCWFKEFADDYYRNKLPLFEDVEDDGLLLECLETRKPIRPPHRLNVIQGGKQ